jgi:hypothetical protein
LAKRSQIPEIDRFDGRRTGRLAGDLPLTLRIYAVTDNEDMAVSVDWSSPGRFKTLL